MGAMYCFMLDGPQRAREDLIWLADSIRRISFATHTVQQAKV